MIVLRNLMLAIAAFFVAGVGFYSYLLNALPPDQVQARAAAPATQTGTAPSEGSSSGWSLAAAVMADFLAARREEPPATGDVGEPNAQAMVVPEWLSQRFDKTAQMHEKAITLAQKQALLTTLLDLRTLQQQHLANQGANQNGEGGGERTPLSLGLTTRAMQAELQFRQSLGVGLAEFMKQMAPADLARLLAIPLPEASPVTTAPGAQIRVSAGVTPTP